MLITNSLIINTKSGGWSLEIVAATIKIPARNDVSGAYLPSHNAEIKFFRGAERPTRLYLGSSWCISNSFRSVQNGAVALSCSFEQIKCRNCEI